MATLLVIGALVLLVALMFGLGYSLGRTDGKYLNCKDKTGASKIQSGK